MKNRLLLIFIVIGSFVLSPSWAAEFDARLHWAHKVEISTLVSGVINKINVDVGDHVNKGQVLLSLSPTSFKTKIDRARADMESARLVLEEAQREKERSKELFDRTVASVHEIQLVENELAKAKAQYESARTSLAISQLNFGHSIQKAPFDSLVVKRLAQPGQTVVTRQQATPLLVLVDSRQMLARVSIKEQQLAKLSKGKAVTIKVAGREFRGMISSVGLESFQGKGGNTLFVVDAIFPVKHTDNLLAGMKAIIILP